jgi:uncharacterized alpha-E superfamily protein
MTTNRPDPDVSELPVDRKDHLMLLSRVAESVYWSSRYLERAEATARLLKIHTEMFLDLPREVGVGWEPLLAVTGTRTDFDERHTEATEDAVVRFLATEPTSSASIIASVGAARANFRVTRAIFPNSSWEELNRLFLWTGESRSAAVDRKTRLAWMDRVIRDCQVLRGLLSSTMSHDAAYSFVEIGRAIECADMTTRILDVQAGVLLAELGSSSSTAATYADITWASVLKSLGAHQMFRRTVRAGISGTEALRFLLCDPQFPRSVEHSLTRISRSLLELPRYDVAMTRCAQVQALLVDAEVGELTGAALHEYVDDLQIGISDLHSALTDTYFHAVVDVSRVGGALLATA